MAHVYVRSGASGTNDGSSKTNAYTTLQAAYAAKAAGDNFWVAADHAQTQASALTLNSPGTLAAPCTAMCVDFAGSTPPVSADLRTTATITTTGTNAMSIARGTHYYGITFSAGTGATNALLTLGDGNAHLLYFLRCVLRKLGTTGDTQAILIDGFSTIIFDNTSVNFGIATDAIMVNGGGAFRWINTATPVVSVFPDTLIYSKQAGKISACGVDFSAAGFSGKRLFSYAGVTTSDTLLVNCKLHASLTQSSTADGYEGNFINIMSDSGATNYRHEKSSKCGSHIIETTIFRTGGASDGVTPVAWKVVTSSTASWLAPFESLPLSIKNNTTGATVVVTIFGIWGGGAVPTTRDIWPVISYMGSSGSPLATIVSGGAADYLATATNWATDSSTWGGSTTKFKMAITLSSPQPQLKGPINVTIFAAAASSTFYIDPKIVLS